MRSKVFYLLSIVILASMILSACGGAATPAPKPTEAPKAEEVKPTEAPKMEEKPTEAPKAEEVKPTEAPKMEEKPTEAPKAEEAKPTEAPKMEEKPTEATMKEMGVDPASLSGSIYAAGSSTVYPLSEAIAERFKEDGFTGEIKIDSIGSGAGFERFCKSGESDISNASRKIKDGEVENCKAIGRNPIELRVGTDAIAVVVSKENDFLKGVTLEELAKIFSSEAKQWADVNPAWPKEDILRFVPGTDSGTYDFFIEEVMDKVYVMDKEKDKDKGKQMFLQAANLQQSEDDNVLVQGVEGSPYAIGFFGFAYYNEAKDKMKAISINGIEPNEKTAESGEYPLSRPLFMYTDAKIFKEKPQVAGFIKYYLDIVNDVILDVGYFPASKEAIEASKQALENALK